MPLQESRDIPGEEMSTASASRSTSGSTFGRLKIVGAHLLATLGCSVAFAEEPTFIGYHPMVPRTLGSGISLADPGANMPDCLVNVEGTSISGARETSSDTFLVTNSSQLRQTLGIDLRIDASYLTFSGGANFSFSSENLFDDYSITMVVKAWSEYAPFKLKPTAALAPSAKAIRSNGPKFVSKCGTHYVDAVRRGSTVSAVITIFGLSSTEKRDTVAGMVASGGWGAASASVKAKFEEHLQRVTQSNNSRVQVVATGGEGIKDFGGIIRALAAGKDSLASVQVALAKMVETLDEGNSAQLGFWIRPFSDFDVDTKALDLWSDLKSKAMSDMVSEYRKVGDLVESANGILSGTDIRQSLVSPSQRTAIEKQLLALLEYQTQLAIQHSACKETTAIGALATNCKKPTPPASGSAIPGIPPQPVGRFRVDAEVGIASAADTATSPVQWSDVESRTLVYDQPVYGDIGTFLSGPTLLPAARTKAPFAKSARLTFSLSGPDIIDGATLKVRTSLFAPDLAVRSLPVPKDGTFMLYSVISDDATMPAGLGDLGQALLEAVGAGSPGQDRELFLEVRDKLGRSTHVPVVNVVGGMFSWAR